MVIIIFFDGISAYECIQGGYSFIPICFPLAHKIHFPSQLVIWCKSRNRVLRRNKDVHLLLRSILSNCASSYGTYEFNFLILFIARRYFNTTVWLVSSLYSSSRIVVSGSDSTAVLNFSLSIWASSLPRGLLMILSLSKRNVWNS